MRLNPIYPPYYLFQLGRAYHFYGRTEDAMAALKRALARDPDFLACHIYLAAIYSELGRQEEAQAKAAEVLRINPNFSLEGYRKNSPLKDRARVERILDLLRKAGLK